MRISRRASLIIGLVVLSVGAGSGLAFASLGGDESHNLTGAELAGSYSTAPIVAPTALQRSSFGILRRPAREADVMPAEVRRVLDRDGELERKYGANLDLARSAPGPDNRGRVWLVPGQGQMCLFIPDTDGFGGTCQSTKAAQDGLLIVSLRGSIPQSAADTTAQSTTPGAMGAVVPDGVTSVQLTGSSSSRTVAVSDNVVTSAIGGFEHLSFNDAAGTHTIAIP